MKSTIIFFSLLAIFFSGCNQEKKTVVPQTMSNVNVITSHNPAAKFPSAGKYAFAQFPSETSEDSEAAMIEQRVRTALSGELKKKGYKPGEYENINFFVVYALGLQQQIDVLIGKSKTQGNEWISAVVVPNDYVKGALLVQIVDAGNMEPVWLGIFNADVALESVTEQEKQARVRYAVGELLKSFPPK